MSKKKLRGALGARETSHDHTRGGKYLLAPDLFYSVVVALRHGHRIAVWELKRGEVNRGKNRPKGKLMLQKIPRGVLVPKRYLPDSRYKLRGVYKTLNQFLLDGTNPHEKGIRFVKKNAEPAGDRTAPVDPQPEHAGG